MSCSVTMPDSSTKDIPTDAVLLATNGYGADPALVSRHMPEIATATYHGSETSRGDALRTGQRLDAYQGHGALARMSQTLVGWVTIMHGGVLLDTTGHRFDDESVGCSEFGPKLIERPESRGWIVLDKRIHDLCLPFTDFRQSAESGALLWADTLTDLASAMNLPVAAAELTTVASIARGERPDPLGRRNFEAVLRPPYAAVQVVPALFRTQGGPRVELTSGDVLPGLYSANGDAAGISGHGASGYLAGNGLLSALDLPNVAATHAAHG